jgi:hypothetical protein
MVVFIFQTTEKMGSFWGTNQEKLEPEKTVGANKLPEVQRSTPAGKAARQKSRNRAGTCRRPILAEAQRESREDGSGEEGIV